MGLLLLYRGHGGAYGGEVLPLLLSLRAVGSSPTPGAELNERRVKQMNYGQIRDRALQLIDQYSVAGETVALTYNNQEDYVKKIPGLVNDALELLFTGYRKIRATAALPTLGRVKFGENTAYVLPDDCWQMSSAGMVTFDEHGSLVRWHKYHLLEEKMFVLDGPEPHPLIVEYYRHPRLFGDEPKDTEQSDGPIEMQMCIPYYAAAHLVIHDNPYAYAALYNEFENRAQRLIELPHAELGVVEDCYSFGFGGDC